MFLKTLGRPDLRGEDIDQSKFVQSGFSEQEGEGFDGLRRRCREIELNELGEESKTDLYV
jgi:hypothetical protein